MYKSNDLINYKLLCFIYSVKVLERTENEFLNIKLIFPPMDIPCDKRNIPKRRNRVFLFSPYSSLLQNQPHSFQGSILRIKERKKRSKVEGYWDLRWKLSSTSKVMGKLPSIFALHASSVILMKDTSLFMLRK